MFYSLRLTSIALLTAVSAAFLAGPIQAQTPTTTIQNGNTDTRLQLNYDGGLYVPGIFGPATPADSIPATGAGTRMMWYPAKAAFRAGRVGDRQDGTQWNASKVGNYSVAFGVDAKASGRHSVSIGDNTQATDGGAVAMGQSADATGGEAVSIGKATEASGTFAVALGRQARAQAQAAVALGQYTEATAASSVALGGRAEALNATSMGEGTASGEYATAMGYYTTASGNHATSMGRETIAATSQSLSTGLCNSANTSADNTLFVVGSGTFDTNNFECSSRDDAFTVNESGSATASSHDTFSDRRLKTEIEPLGNGVLEDLQQIDPVRYHFKDQSAHPSGRQVGFLAQDVRKEFPSLVSKGSGGYLSLAYPKMTAVLLKGLQEQQAQISDLKAENEEILVENEKLRTRIDQIKDLKERLAALEAERSSSVVAGLTGSSTGLLLAFLLGGLFGAGLLWRGRS